MQQVLFTVPVLKSWFPPDGIPVYGFGAMLFITFILVTLWGTVRAKRIGMDSAKFQDFTIWVFISGIIGARILYMLQYSHEFNDHTLRGMAGAFFRIWEGGIVFYGSAAGGVIGYGLFYWFVMRRMADKVNGWQLADAVAPLLALGLAIGRMGCYLNGCCWGQVANEEACVVPLGTAHFPVLPAHARTLLVNKKYLQTTTGFTVKPRDRFNAHDDPRTEVGVVEKDSEADRAGVKPGDRVVEVNGKPNSIIMELSGSDETLAAVEEKFKGTDNPRVTRAGGRVRVEFDGLVAFLTGKTELAKVAPDATPFVFDRLEELTRDWPRGKAELRLAVERATKPDEPAGKPVDIAPFSPGTVGLYPTQLYETVSMVLLIFVLLAFYPYRRHDGQLMVVLMLGYAAHRYINESLRVEPSYGGGLTLSQWASVIVVVSAVAIEAYLWWAMPSRWKAEKPAEQASGTTNTQPAGK